MMCFNKTEICLYITVVFICLPACTCDACEKKAGGPVSERTVHLDKISRCTPQLLARYQEMLALHFRAEPGGKQGSLHKQWAHLSESEKNRFAQGLIRPVIRIIVETKRKGKLDVLFRREYQNLSGCFAKEDCDAFAACFTDATGLTYLDSINAHALPNKFARVKEEEKFKSLERTDEVEKDDFDLPQEKTPLSARIRVTQEPHDLSKHEKKLDLRSGVNSGPPCLWLHHGERLIWLKPASDGLKKMGSVDLTLFGSRHVQMAAGRHGQVLVQTKRALLLLTASLTPVVVWKPQDGEILGSIYVDNDKVYLGAGGDFVILDSRFRQIARLDLKIKKPGKEVHDIIIHDNQAFLLDNIVRPALFFRIDVSDPAKPRMLQRILESGIYLHLVHQWICKKTNRWAIMKNTSGRGGTRQSVLLLDSEQPSKEMTHPAEDSKDGGGKQDSKTFRSARPFGPRSPAILHEELVYSWRPMHHRTRGSIEKDFVKHETGWIKGYRFLSGSKEPPHWGVFERADRIFLGKIHTKSNGIELRDMKKLDVSMCIGWSRKAGEEKKCTRRRFPKNAVMGHRKNWVVAAVGNELLWFSVGGKPKLVRQHNNPYGRPSRVFIINP